MGSEEKDELLKKMLAVLKEIEVEEANSIKSSKSPHFWWLICLMGAVILALIAALALQANLTHGGIADYVSAFSVLLSILLSIFAIQYTYHSNAQVERQFNDINRAAHNIIETSKELKATESIMKSAIEKIHEHMQSNVLKIDNLRSDFNNLKAQIQNNDPVKYKKDLNTTQNPESIKNIANTITTTGSPSITGTSSDDKTEDGKADEDETQK